jgi:cellulose synthase/poly-beta-1,6-N-acetylglucosamine synthase-like glycosyltransferase
MRERRVAAAIGSAADQWDVWPGTIPASDRHGIPLVSVVMTTYKDDIDVLWRAIDSILTQTIGDLECVVVFEPGDPNAELVSRRCADPRLHIVRSATRLGMAASFNLGLENARGRYIARMDSDDIAYPFRLERQLRFLDDHPDIALVGSAARLIDRDGNVVGIRRFPITHEEILQTAVITNPFLHPTVVWDRTRVKEQLRYDPRYMAEDLELWLRLLRGGYRVANMPDLLIDYTQPLRYTRSAAHWRGLVRVRLAHWHLGLKRPLAFVTIVVIGCISLLPQRFIDALIGRNRLSDHFRSIQPSRVDPAGPESRRELDSDSDDRSDNG